jgi:hypothetical protein
MMRSIHKEISPPNVSNQQKIGQLGSSKIQQILRASQNAALHLSGAHRVAEPHFSPIVEEMTSPKHNKQAVGDSWDETNQKMSFADDTGGNASERDYEGGNTMEGGQPNP